jgi:hypothetical protein
MTDATALVPRMLDLVVPGAEDFFQRLQPENWPWSPRFLPLSVRIPVLAGVARVVRVPERWIDKLVGAVAPPHQARLLHCFWVLSLSDRIGPRILPHSQILRQY